MLKLIAYIIIPVVAFPAAVVACLAITGNLSKDTYSKLTAPEPVAEETETATPTESSDPLLRAIKLREEELNKREARLKEGEDRLKKSQSDLEALRTELEALQKKIAETVKTEDANQQKRMTDVANSLGKMKAENAASTLDAWTVDEAASVLRLIKDKERGKILDAMKPEKAGAVLQALRTPKF